MTLPTFLANQEQCVSTIRTQLKKGKPPETFNGPGSQRAIADPVRRHLPGLLVNLQIVSLLDAPCGDGNWIGDLDLGGVAYIGLDLEPETLALARSRRPDGEFRLANILTQPEPLPHADAILCRDFLIHLPNEAITLLIERFRDSGARFLLTTHCPDADNRDPAPLDGGDRWPGYFERAVNLTTAPFDLPDPVAVIPDPIPLDPWRTKTLAAFALR